MHWKIVVFFLCKDKKTKDDNFSSSKHDIMYVIHRMREICRKKTREISKGADNGCNSSFLWFRFLVQCVMDNKLHNAESYVKCRKSEPWNSPLKWILKSGLNRNSLKILCQEAANQKGKSPLVASWSRGQVSTRNGHETRLNVTVIVPPNHVMSVQIDHHSQKVLLNWCTC